MEIEETIRLEREVAAMASRLVAHPRHAINRNALSTVCRRVGFSAKQTAASLKLDGGSSIAWIDARAGTGKPAATKLKFRREWFRMDGSWAITSSLRSLAFRTVRPGETRNQHRNNSDQENPVERPCPADRSDRRAETRDLTEIEQIGTN